MNSALHVLFALLFLLVWFIVAICITIASVQTRKLKRGEGDAYDNDSNLHSAYTVTTTLAVIAWVGLALLIIFAILLVVAGGAIAVIFGPEIAAFFGVTKSVTSRQETASIVYENGKAVVVQNQGLVKKGLSAGTIVLLGGASLLLGLFGLVSLYALINLLQTNFDTSNTNYKRARNALLVGTILSFIALSAPLIILGSLSYYKRRQAKLLEAKTQTSMEEKT